jgi:hypothetical protein
MKTPFDDLGKNLPCVCLYKRYAHECFCPDGETALRYYEGTYRDMPQMTMDQRAWCVAQIESVEGHKADGHEFLSDAGLAGMVLTAWADYALDKGLL